jgi:hypothetical protein
VIFVGVFPIKVRGLAVISVFYEILLVIVTPPPF